MRPGTAKDYEPLAYVYVGKQVRWEGNRGIIPQKLPEITYVNELKKSSEAVEIA